MGCANEKRGLAAIVGVAAAVAFGAGTLVGASERQPEMEQTDPDAMMQVLRDANQMGEHHEHLTEMVGVWDGVLTAEGFETKGVMTNEMVMGGRFLQGTWQGDMWGEAFTGISLMGYSSIEDEHQGVWYDSTANQIWYTTGSCSDDGVITMHGEETDPMSGMTRKYKDVMQMHGEDKMSFERFYMTTDGEMSGFKIEYTRRG